MKNLLFLIFCAFSLFVAIYYYRQYHITQQELLLANKRILDRDTEIYKLQKRAGSSTPATPATAQVVASPSTLGQLSPAALNQLKGKGLQNPEADLKESLTANQPTILTQKGALGGTMAIRDIQILSEHYALAYFEDGHTGGYLVLRYDVKPGGRVTWIVLDSYIL